MSPPRIAVVMNPASRGGALGRRWPELAHKLRRHLGSFEERRTERPGDAERETRAALLGGADTVVAVGGDGTIGEVANGFFQGERPLRPDAALGVLPFGTGGDFRRSLPMPSDLERACAVLATGRRRRIDLGRVEFCDDEGAHQSRLFINVASFGISGAIDRRVNRSKKRFGGRLSFVAATVGATLEHENRRVRIVFDDDPQSALEPIVHTVAIANGRYFGGGMKIAPAAALDDGHFDVVALGDLSLVELLRYGRRIYSGSHLSIDKVSTRRARQLTAESTDGSEILLDIDGEAPGRLPARFAVVPGALLVVGP